MNEATSRDKCFEKSLVLKVNLCTMPQYAHLFTWIKALDFTVSATIQGTVCAHAGDKHHLPK